LEFETANQKGLCRCGCGVKLTASGGKHSSRRKYVSGHNQVAINTGGIGRKPRIKNFQQHVAKSDQVK
jgi:hypothetical protein